LQENQKANESWLQGGGGGGLREKRETAGSEREF